MTQTQIKPFTNTMIAYDAQRKVDYMTTSQISLTRTGATGVLVNWAERQMLKFGETFFRPVRGSLSIL